MFVACGSDGWIEFGIVNIWCVVETKLEERDAIREMTAIVESIEKPIQVFIQIRNSHFDLVLHTGLDVFAQRTTNDRWEASCLRAVAVHRLTVLETVQKKESLV